MQKDERGQGYARAMLQFVIEQAALAGKDKIVLNVNRNNPVVPVYEHLGFVKTGEEKNDIGSGFFMDDFVFTYTIDTDGQ